jgi:ATP-GRASP peptide maturase of grasp-with-spasm system
MVLILSECGDVSTDYAIEWFYHYDIPFVRVNDNNLVNIISLMEFRDGREYIEFKIRDRVFSLDDITAVWFRRGAISFTIAFPAVSCQEESLNQQALRLLQQENKTMAQYIVAQLLSKASLNNQFHYNANKLLVLMHAARVGLHIPHTLITDKQQEVWKKMGTDADKIITKPIQDIVELKIGSSSQSQYTEALSGYAAIPERFYYSLFQEKVDKKYELRVFFIKEDFYACAIFSPATDGRDLYAGKKLARIVPYRLPQFLREQLIALNKLIHLDCGSMDILVDRQNKYYFLEVNPVGQYDYVSKACNYDLNQKIALYFKHATNLI